MDISPLLERPFWVIDILPKQVKPQSRGQFFAVEQHYLRDEGLREKFAAILLKLNCYEDLNVCVNDEWTMNPDPAKLAEGVRVCGHIDILAGQALITVNDDDTYITIYNPDDELLELMNVLAEAEGLFLWQPPQ